MARITYTPAQLKALGLSFTESGQQPSGEQTTSPKANKKPSESRIKVDRLSEIPVDENGCTTIKFKPLSVNDAWKGERYKTDAYKDYEYAILLLLPKDIKVPKGLLSVYFEYGLSSMGGDWDNPIKPFQDILQTKYKFNDSVIMEATVKKVIVEKGLEYIRFKLEKLTT